jgi:hypothetical protein
MKGDDVHIATNVEETTGTTRPEGRDLTTRFRRSGGLAALAAVAALGLAGCGGGPGSPKVASLSTTTTTVGRHSNGNTGGGSVATLPTGDATRLLDDWATCMHSHGDPDQADPVIGSDKSIQIWIDISGINPDLSEEVHGGTAPCNQYLTAAQMALRDGQPFPQPPSEVTEVKFAECMRANGVPNYPNPSGPDGSETKFNGTGIDPNSPHVQNVDTYCTAKLGIHTAYNSTLGDAGDIQVQSGPGSGPPPGGRSGHDGSGANVIPGTAGG